MSVNSAADESDAILQIEAEEKWEDDKVPWCKLEQVNGLSYTHDGELKNMYIVGGSQHQTPTLTAPHRCPYPSGF